MDNTETFRQIDQLLEAIVAADGDFSKLPDELKKIEFRIKGDRFDGTVTGEVIKSLGQLQDTIYRVGAYVAGGSPKSSRLTQEQREQLNLTFKFSKGSLVSEMSTKPFFDFLSRAIEKMESKKVYYLAIIALCGFIGAPVATSYIDYLKQRDQNQKEIIINQLYLQRLADSNEKIHNAILELVKSTKDAEYMKYGALEFDAADIKQLNERAPKQKSKKYQLVLRGKIAGYIKQPNGVTIVFAPNGDTDGISAFISNDSTLFGDSVPSSCQEIGRLTDSGTMVELTLAATETKNATKYTIIDFSLVDDLEQSAPPLLP